MKGIGYNHKVLLWRLAESGDRGVFVERAGFNTRSTMRSLRELGLVEFRDHHTTEHGILVEYGYLTDQGKAWVLENPDRVNRSKR